jgi:hypothetical protein
MIDVGPFLTIPLAIAAMRGPQVMLPRSDANSRSVHGDLHIHRSLHRIAIEFAIALYSVVLCIEEAYYVPETQPNQKFRLSIKRSTK